MSKKLFFILMMLFGLTLISIFAQSCLGDYTYEAKICRVDFTGLNPKYNGTPDTFSDEVGFYITGYTDANCSLKPASFGLISSCYAMTKCARWLNDLETSSFQMLLDQQVVINGKTIAPNSNLFNEVFFSENVKITKNDNKCKFVTLKIMLSPSLLAQMKFEKGIHHVNLNVKPLINEHSSAKDKSFLIRSDLMGL